MTTLLTILFASTLAVPPSATLESGKMSRISYVSYMENGNLMLTKAEQEGSNIITKSIDTGISTNGIEKVTMEIRSDDVCLIVTYLNAESIDAYFSVSALDFIQIQVSEPSLFADLTVLPE